MNKLGKRLLKLSRDITKELDKVEKVFGQNQFLEQELDTLWDMIAFSYGVNLKIYLGSDRALNAIADYSRGEITLKEAEDKLFESYNEQMSA